MAKGKLRRVYCGQGKLRMVYHIITVNSKLKRVSYGQEQTKKELRIYKGYIFEQIII